MPNLCSQLPTNADRDAFNSLKASPPSAETHPHTFAWFTLVYMFDDSVRNTWGGAAAAPAKGGKPAAKQEAKKEAPKTEAPKKADDDEMDLFGDDEPTEVRTLYLIGNPCLSIKLGRKEGS